MAIHEKISLLRKALGLSREAFAEQINIPANTIKSIELKGVIPRCDVVEAIAKSYPEYAFWLVTDKTDPPRHIAPSQEVSDSVLFDVIEFIDQNDLVGGESFVDRGKMNGVIFLVEDTEINRSMNIFVDVWIDEIKNSVQERYFAPPAISVDPRFDLWLNDYPSSARDFKRWCDASGITKFRLKFVKEGSLSEIRKSKLIFKSSILTEPQDSVWNQKILGNFNLWKEGKL